MNACPDETTLDDFVGGRLSGPRLVDFDKHLDGCPSCREVVGLLAGASGSSGERGLGPGGRVGGYTLGELLGEGASGRVFRAWDPRLERAVALKVLHPEVAADPRARVRFLREARAMARLAHPHVVSVYDAGEDPEGELFVAMELVRGPTLRAWLGGGERSVEEVVAAVRTVGEGLAAAHAEGVLHRDVKPDNVIVADGRARLTDFGLARVEADPSPKASAETRLDPAALTRTGALVGTPLYMAPELLDGAPATEGSDLYALAVTAYEALAGVRPFEADALGALREALARGPRPIARRGVSRRLDAWVRAGLGARPSERPGSVRAWLDQYSASERQRLWRVRGAGAALGVLGLTALGMMASGARGAGPGRCDGRGEITAELGPGTLGAIEAGFVRTGAPHAREGARWAVAELGRWGSRWAVGYARACREGASGGGLSAATAARAQCYARARAQTGALARALAAPTREGVVGVRRAVTEALPAVEACDDVRALGDMDPRPVDPVRSARAAMAERAVGEARAALGAGAFGRALEAADRAVAHGDASGWGVITAEARRLRATALRRSGRAAEAEGEARRAALRAEASRDDRGAALAWLERVAAQGERGLWAEVALAIEQAEASVTRAGDPAMRASLELLRGLASSNLGRLPEARAALQRALDLRTGLGLDRSPVLTALANVAREAGDLDRALALHTEAMALDEARDGPSHPDRARHLHNLGGVLRRRGDAAGARGRYLEALAIEDRALPAGAVERGLTRNSLGLLALESGDLDEADRWLRAAEAMVGQGPERSLVLRNRASLALRRGAFVEAAGLAREALSRDRAGFGEGHPRVVQDQGVLDRALEGVRATPEAPRPAVRAPSRRRVAAPAATAAPAVAAPVVPAPAVAVDAGGVRPRVVEGGYGPAQRWSP